MAIVPRRRNLKIIVTLRSFWSIMMHMSSKEFRGIYLKVKG